jgi:hypothetical protein
MAAMIDPPAKKPHKHAEAIKAWADGATIQFFDAVERWQDVATPAWYPDRQYRVKPPMVEQQHIHMDRGSMRWVKEGGNLLLTFEDGVLTGAEVLK